MDKVPSNVLPSCMCMQMARDSRCGNPALVHSKIARVDALISASLFLAPQNRQPLSVGVEACCTLLLMHHMIHAQPDALKV